ncbi:MAG: glycosyltransferase family 4 protein [Kaiparowitsia implicata GSE-PSE-MK54-09C]|jgi:glycosyltransferase involved in cell wall biosynthesis|nr:glycosyltransferase family 4 protein [Kaiparowitsia implicata GSE-PSE-MK54-09C]
MNTATTHSALITTHELQPTDKVLEHRVFFIGQRYAHHAKHSGYEGFSRYVGTLLASPVKFRWISEAWGWELNKKIASFTRHPFYSLGAGITEVSTLFHMALRRNCVYHFLYGDSDLWLLAQLRWLYRLMGHRVVASFHEPEDCLAALGIEAIAQKIDGIVLVSRAQQRFFEQWVPADQIFVVPHGIDTDYFHPDAAANLDPVCITVGAHLRDFETLGHALTQVWNANPQIHVFAVGTRVDQKNQFAGLDDARLHMLEGISDDELRQRYQQAQVAIFPFNEATANNAVLEALACGLPVVATDIGGIREYVDETTGELCPPQDAQAFASAILNILSDGASRTQKATTSRERALKHRYSLVAHQLHQIYLNLLRR